MQSSVKLLVGGIPTPLKNMSLSVGQMKVPIYGTIEVMFQYIPSGNLTYQLKIAIYNIYNGFSKKKMVMFHGYVDDYQR